MISVQSGFVRSFDGTAIHYEVRGQGEPLVFVYGIACLMNHWHYQVEYFSQFRQVITFDLRGHHLSQAPKQYKDLSLEAIAKDLPYLLRELGHSKADFVGHSFGVQVLLKAQEVCPEIFKSLVFINGFAKNPLKNMFGLNIVEPFFGLIKRTYSAQPQLLESLWSAAVDNPVAHVGAALAGGFNLTLTEFKDIEIYAKGVAQLRLGVLIPYFEDMMKFDGTKSASTISVPTLIISGEKDNVTPPVFQAELSETITTSEFVLVPYGSHCTQLDFPDYTNLKIEKFLSQNKKRAP
jgi:pimeloyl-ACP methyl ester carboxylesterase